MQYISIDFETYLIDKDNLAPKPVCLSWYDGDRKGLITGHSAMEVYLDAILRSNKVLLAHNFKFEGSVIVKHFPKLFPLVRDKLDRGEIICTKLFEKLINNVSKKLQMNVSLGALALKYLNIDMSAEKTDPDAWRMRYSELDGVPQKDWPKAAVDYAINDSIYTLDIHLKQLKQIPNRTYLNKDIQLAVESEFYLTLMAHTGMRIDPDRVKLLEKELKEYLHPRQQYLIDQDLAKINAKGKITKNMKQFREYINDNIPEKEYTEKGSIATSGEALDRYLAKHPDDKVLRSFREIMAYEKVLTSFVSRLLEADPYIYTEYNSVVSSGRTSSSTSKLFPSVNIQQMPRSVEGVTYDIRNCYVPRSGFKICSIDYSGLELSSTAHMLYKTFGWSKMRDTVNEGDSPVDMHSKFACRIKSIKDNKYCSYDDFVANKKKEGYKEIRQLAKPINLGFPGGIGYATMRSLLLREGVKTRYQILEKSQWEDDIKRLVKYMRRNGKENVRAERLGVQEYALVYDELVGLKKELFGLYPDLEKFLSEEHKGYLTGQTKAMKNEYGEWEIEPMYQFDIEWARRDWCTYTAFCNNYLMQSPSSSGAKRMVIDVVKKYYQDERVNILAFIHDEIVFEVLECPEMYDIIQDISEIMIDSMQSVLTSVRIAVEAELFDYWAKAGGFWDKAYWKDADKERLKTC